MPQEDNASRERLLQSRYPLQWIAFAVMWIFGMLAIVMGMATQEAGWNWKYISMYSIWIIATAVFVFLDMKPTKTFVIHYLLYLVGIGTVFWFVWAILKINPDTIPLYIPTCTNLGIFLGIGVEQSWSSWRANGLKLIRIVRVSIAHAWSAEGGTEGELPLLPIHGLDPVQPSPLPHGDDDRPVDE